MIDYNINTHNSLGKRNNMIGLYGEHFINSKCCPKCKGKLILIDKPSIDFKCMKCDKNFEVKCVNKELNNNTILSIRGGKYTHSL